VGVVGSEAMLFGAVMLVFLICPFSYGPAFAAASKHLSLPLGTLNTAVLITSSFAMALAHLFSTAGRQRAAALALGATTLLGIVVLAIKGTEYAMEFHAGIAPVLSAPFTFDGPDPAHAQLFFSLYFAMTGLHGLHLIGGIAVIGWLLAFWRRSEPASRIRRIHAAGLYWHFVDVVWVFLFPILYLINR